MSSEEPANTSAEERREEGGSAPVEVPVAVENGQIEITDAPPNAGPSYPGTPDGNEAGATIGNDNTSTMAMDTSPAEGLRSQDGAVSNGQVVESAKTSGDSDGTKPSRKTLEDAEVLFNKGCDALACDDFVEAVDSLSRALEIRVAHYGELAPECASTYYKYGCALLYKSQDETNVLNESVTMAKRADASNNVKGETSMSDVKGEASEGSCNGVKAEVSMGPVSDTKGKASACHANGVESTMQEKTAEDGQESDDEDADENVEEEIEEEESDLDLAWKMLDIARVILEKQPGDTVEKAKVRTALGDVSLEREDFETCLGDYFDALSKLEGLVEPDSRLIAELCFKICLALQLINKTGDALVYCQKARSICESRLQRLVSEIDGSKGGTSSKSEEGVVENANGNIQNDSLATDGKNNEIETLKHNEIEVLKQLLIDLSEKIEDLQQMISSAPLSDVVRELDAKLASRDKNAFPGGNSSQESAEGTGFDLPTLTNAPNGSVTHLGVVGRGVKRAAPVLVDPSEPAIKRHSMDPVSAANPEPSLLEPSVACCQSSFAEVEKVRD